MTLCPLLDVSLAVQPAAGISSGHALAICGAIARLTALPSDLFLVSEGHLTRNSRTLLQRQRMVTHVYRQVICSCAKQSTACFAPEIVTQGVHPKGKPVLNDGTAILNFFVDLAFQTVTK
jgi:hypothetical protein